jgi:hypothetical protein
MNTKGYQTYEEATQEYLNLFRALRDEPPAITEAVSRGAADIPAEILIERADDIASVSASMIPLAREYLQAPEATLREGISGQLLAQAAAELQVAPELMQVAAEEGGGPAVPGTARGATRAARGDSLREAIDGMERVLATPVSDGLLPAGLVRRGVTAANTPEEAKKELKKAASLTRCYLARDRDW